MSPNVLEMNEDKINENKCITVNFIQCFSCYVKEKLLGSVKKIAGPVDPRYYWSYRASNILS